MNVWWRWPEDGWVAALPAQMIRQGQEEATEHREEHRDMCLSPRSLHKHIKWVKEAPINTVLLWKRQTDSHLHWWHQGKIHKPEPPPIYCATDYRLKTGGLWLLKNTNDKTSHLWCRDVQYASSLGITPWPWSCKDLAVPVGQNHHTYSSNTLE